jgi:hypothetical protein
MMSTNQDGIELQRIRLFTALTSPDLQEACTLNHGIVALTDQESQEFQSYFNSARQTCCFFIPSSGVGSRMFDFLQGILASDPSVTSEAWAKFFEHIPSFAFYEQICPTWKDRISAGTFEKYELIEYLLGPDGLNFAKIPKALFPFHNIKGRLTTPFEGHLRQAFTFPKTICEVHFSIQGEHVSHFYKQDIYQQHKDKITFSVQNKNTDSFVFDEFQSPVKGPDGVMLTRPSGHGALLDNLEQLKADIIFVKNIDNIQCVEYDSLTHQSWASLGGLLAWIRNAFKAAIDIQDIEKIKELSQRFSLFSTEDLQKFTLQDFSIQLNRPWRVCGMVPTEGKPGGGPFWVNTEGRLTKQIVEKSQISPQGLHQLSESSHFNPVFMALCTKDLMGNPLNLNSFVQHDFGMAVKKNLSGKTIYFLEKPGLWNGSMHHWNTIFIEIPPAVFTPVKSVLDLLEPCHFC